MPPDTTPTAVDRQYWFLPPFLHFEVGGGADVGLKLRLAAFGIEGAGELDVRGEIGRVLNLLAELAGVMQG